MNEILTNAMKHAFKNTNDGKILLTLKKTDENNLKLVIKDNGSGLPPGLEEKISMSLGFQLIKSLTQQIHGSLDYTSNNGTEFEINFPIPLENKNELQILQN